MATTIGDIVASLESEIATTLGSSYKKLEYLIDVQKNNFRTSSDRYGVRALEASEIPGVTKYTTFTQSFEVVTTKSYYESALDDSEQVQAGLDLRANMLDMYKDITNAKGGLPAVILNITDLVMAEVEYLTEDKVAVLRSTMNISYRLNLL